MPPDALPLTCFHQGQKACIHFIGMTGQDAERLRHLGLREGRRVCVMMNGDKCILGFDACRVALQREVAMQLFATPT